MSQSGYLLGVGSNISPHENIAQIVALLLKSFSPLQLSRVLEIPPIGMNSQHDFLNVVIFIETTATEMELKSVCNAIEVQLGRDRSDPDRKTKDRSADLDILTHISLPADQNRPALDMTDEYFIYPLIDELIAYLLNQHSELNQAGIPLNIDNLTFGQTATTINRDASTGNKGIV